MERLQQTETRPVAYDTLSHLEGPQLCVSRHNAEPIQMFEQLLSLRLRAAKSEETDVFTFAVQLLNGNLTTYLIILIITHLT